VRASRFGRDGANEGVMEDLLSEYLPILVFLAIAGAIAVAMVGASFLLARQQPNSEKLSPYECGFDPFEDARVLEGIETAFIGRQLLGIGLLASEQERGADHRHRNRAGNREKHQDRQVLA